MNKEKFAELFPFGSHLCREPMPAMSEMKKDIENLKKHGFNLIKLQENWAVDEPLEGHLDLSKYEELIEHAGKLDLGVYLGLTCEQAPGWIWRKYPESRMVGKNGLPIAYEAQHTLPCDGKPGPCYDHPGAMEEMLRFIKALVRKLGKYENIVVWNTWQEIAYWPETIVLQDVCFCENTLNHFRKWLKEKYGDLDGLNKAWNTRIRDWSYVQPDRLPNIKACLPQDIDWKYFMQNIQIANVLKKRYEAIKEVDPFNRPVFAHKSFPTIGSGEDWTYARCSDYVGSSCYPAWTPGNTWDDVMVKHDGIFEKHDALLGETWGYIAINSDYIRSANKPESQTWLSEFQGGPVSTGFHLGRVPEADDIRRWLLSSIASGITGISFWVTRAEIAAGETNGFNLLDSEGDTTKRYEEAGRIGRALNKHAALFAKPTKTQAEVAILVDEYNYRLCSSMLQGGDNLSYSIRGWYKLLWDAGIPIDFVEVSQLDEEYSKNYKTFILPFPLSISEITVNKLTKLVELGSNLISEAAIGRLNQNGFANRGELSPAAKELFGVKHKSFQMVREPKNGKRWSPQERTWGEYLEAAELDGCGILKGFKTRANVYIQTFDCTDSEPFMKYGDKTAATVKKVGKGRAWLIGTYVGHSGTAYKSEATAEFIEKLMMECGVTTDKAGKLLIRKRVTDKKEAWLFTNPTDATVTEKIKITEFNFVEDLLGEEVIRLGDYVEITVKSLDVKVLVLNKK